MITTTLSEKKTNNIKNSIWHNIFPLYSNEYKYAQWNLFFNNSGYLNNILQPNWDNTTSSLGGFFSSFSIDYNIIHAVRTDAKVLLSASNALHSALLSYLWGLRGNTVFLTAKEGQDLPFSSSELSEAENILQRLINENFQFNNAISLALKNAIDFGVGYVTNKKGYYENLHPMFVGNGRTRKKKEKFYIFDRGDCYTIFGKKGELSAYLKIDNKIERGKYFAIDIYYKFNENKEYFEQIGEVFSDNVPMIIELEIPFYKNMPEIPVGCGIVALSALEKASSLSCHVFRAQKTELNPPAFVSSLLNPRQNIHDMAGCSEIYDSVLVGANELVAMPTPARAGNGGVYLEMWRQQVRSAYMLDQIASFGVGQTTAIDAQRNAQLNNSIFAQTIEPFFSSFMENLMTGFIKYSFKRNSEVPSYISSGFKDKSLIGIRYVGQFTADLINTDMRNIQMFAQTISTLAQLDPNIIYVANTYDLVYKLMSDTLPSSFFRKRDEFEQLVAQVQQQLQQQQNIANAQGTVQ